MSSNLRTGEGYCRHRYSLHVRYKDRAEAGRVLGEALITERVDGDGSPLVLGIPRGGVPVAAEVARLLEGNLDVAIAHKLGAPGNPEFAIGAIAEIGEAIVNEDVVRRFWIPNEYLTEEIERQRAEIGRRSRLYRGESDPPDPAGREVVVVDDGIATGATVEAVIRGLADAKAARVICAVPVGPPESLERLGTLCDQVVCPLQPKSFFAVGGWYEDFHQVEDQEVVDLLAAARE